MGHTSTNLLAHLIFSTKQRAPFITTEIEPDLHAYLGGIVREIGGVALAINGTTDHVHILTRVPAKRSIADLVCLTKTNSSHWVHERWPEHREFAGKPATEHSPSANPG